MLSALFSILQVMNQVCLVRLQQGRARLLFRHCRKLYVIPMPSWVFGVGGAYRMQDLTFNQSGSQIQHCPQMSESGLS